MSDPIYIYIPKVDQIRNAYLQYNPEFFSPQECSELERMFNLARKAAVETLTPSESSKTAEDPFDVVAALASRLIYHRFANGYKLFTDEILINNNKFAVRMVNMFLGLNGGYELAEIAADEGSFTINWETSPYFVNYDRNRKGAELQRVLAIHYRSKREDATPTEGMEACRSMCDRFEAPEGFKMVKDGGDDERDEAQELVDEVNDVMDEIYIRAAIRRERAPPP